MRPRKELVKELLAKLAQHSPVHLDPENLLDLDNQQVYSQEEVISALEYLLHENYISGLILYDDQGLAYHFTIDSLTYQGRVCLDSLEKEA